eukprot:2673402-Pleurochrysis_carterae.AAC.1
MGPARGAPTQLTPKPGPHQRARRRNRQHECASVAVPTTSYAVPTTSYAHHYDGVAMYKRLKSELASATDAHDAEMHERAVENMRDDVLPDNSSGQDFADKIQKLLRDHNPHLPVPYSGERLGRLMIRLLPRDLDVDGRLLLRALEDSGDLADEIKVFEMAERIVKMAHRPEPMSNSVAVAAATYRRQKTPAKTAYEAATSAIAAAAAAAHKKSQSGRTPPGTMHQLPDGKTCSKGTCHFAHDL